MCDFSLQSVKSRPAKIADNLTVRDFGTGTATDQARVLFEMGELKGVELERCLVSWRDDLEHGRTDHIPRTILHNLGVA